MRRRPHPRSGRRFVTRSYGRGCWTSMDMTDPPPGRASWRCRMLSRIVGVAPRYRPMHRPRRFEDMGESAKDPGTDRESFIVDCLVKAFSGPDGSRPRRVPDQVPQDGRRPVRVLSRQRVRVLRRRRRPRGPVGRRADQPRLDPGRPARGELRDIYGRRRCADLRRQRLRRGLCRALHLGPSAVRGQRRVDVLAEGAV